jgi:hypothetical protein
LKISTINKTKLTASIAIVLLIASAFVVMINAPVQAQDNEPVPGPLPSGVTPEWTESTRAFLSFRPNPVGVNQIIMVNMWVNPALHKSRYYKDYKITITDPNGNKEIVTLDSYHADTTGWFEYTVDQVGEWTLKFDFPGAYFPAAEVAGGWGEAPTVRMGSTYYEPSSTKEQTLTVQEDMVYSWPDLGLPTDYWERPASLEHREWWSILGGYPGTGYVGGGSIWDELYPGTNPRWSAAYDFHPWAQGPNTAHIVWKEQRAIAGLIGGYTYYAGITTRGVSTPDLVYAGRCYDTMTVPVDGVPTSCAVCYDLRTGEMYYAIPTADGGVTPNIISYNPPGEGSVPGAEAQNTYSVELLSISGGNLLKVNADTGAVSTYPIPTSIGSGSISYTATGDSRFSSIGGDYYTNQEVMAIQNIGNETHPDYRLIKWTTAGSSRDFASRILSNTTYGRSSWMYTDYGDNAEVAYRFHSNALIDFTVGIGVVVATSGWNGPTRVYERYQIQNC